MPAPTITSGSFVRALEPGLAMWFGDAYAEADQIFNKIFEEKKSKKAREYATKKVGFGLAKNKTQGGEVYMDYAKQGYTNTVEMITYGLGFEITEEAIEDNQYEDLASSLTPDLGHSLRTTKEIIAHNIFNRGWTSGYTYGDGALLMSASHPTESAGNLSNILSTSADFSGEALKALYYQMGRAKNDRNLPMKLRGQKIFIPVELEVEAKETVKSALKADTANNNMNFWAKESLLQDVIVSPYLTSTKSWFVLTDCPKSLMYYNRRPVRIKTKPSPGSSENTLVYASERYGFGVNDWRGVYGSQGVS